MNNSVTAPSLGRRAAICRGKMTEDRDRSVLLGPRSAHTHQPIRGGPVRLNTGVSKILGSKVQCLFCFETSTTEGRGGEKGGSANSINKHTEPLTQGFCSSLYIAMPCPKVSKCSYRRSGRKWIAVTDSATALQLQQGTHAADLTGLSGISS